MNLKTFIRSFYLFQFFFDFILIYAVEKLFLLSRGLDLSQIGILLFMWALMAMVLEVPTGMMADRHSRRKMLIATGLFFSLGLIVWIFSNSFWLFLLGYFFRTLGGTFASGTLEAYVFDFLKTHGVESEFEKIWGRGNSYRTLGIGVAVFLGGLLSQISYVIPLAVSSISVLVVSINAYFWPEIKQLTTTGETGYWRSLKDAVLIIRDNHYLLRIVLYTAIVFSAFSDLEEFNDIYLKFLGYPNFVIGTIFALATVGQSLASAFAHKFKNQSWVTLNITAVVGVVILLLAAFIKHPLMAIPILFLGIMLEFSRVLNQGIIQREVPSNFRATIASVNSFGLNIIPLQMVFGFIADKYQLQWSYAFLGIFVLMYFLFIPFIKAKSKNL